MLCVLCTIPSILLSMLSYHIKPGGKLTGEVIPPGDKSISHRAIMLSALANGVTDVTGLLQCKDVLATLEAFHAMGVNIEREGSVIRIHGVGLNGLKQPVNQLNLGNSGTSMRLLAGILAGQTFDSILTGDESLTRRPMLRVVNPLTEMGAIIEAQRDGTAPLTIHAKQNLKGIRYQLPIASAQVKSCLLLAGLYAEGETIIIEPARSRDHTERMLGSFGIKLKLRGNEISLQSPQQLTATNLQIPADISSAAFFMVGATIAPGSTALLRNVGINPTRIGVINILRIMGADIKIVNEKQFGEEPTADLLVRFASLHGIDIPIDQVPLTIDEFPAIFIAAACAKGETRLRSAKELRVKESDRIAAMAKGLQQLGIAAQEQPDGIVIRGGQFHGGEVDSFGDHRIAMAFAMAGLVANQPITIRQCENVATSFPGFVDLAQRAGLKISC